MADETKKPNGAKPWENPKLLTELCVALYQALEANGGLTTKMKDAIPAYLEQQECAMSWSAIRQHIQKLRKTRDTNGITGGAGTPAKTPTKKAAGEKATPKKRSASKKSKETVEDGDDEDVDRLDKDFNDLIKKEEEMDESPSKKPKLESAADEEV